MNLPLPEADATLKIALAMQTMAGTQGDFPCAFGSPVTGISANKGSAT